MSAEQMQAVMTQIQHLVGVVGELAQQQQHQQMQWQQRCAQQNPAVSPPGLGPHVKARKLIDTRFVKIPFFPGEVKDNEDWSFAFKRTMRAANRTTYEILATVEKAGLEIGDEELAQQFAEEDVQGHSSEIYDVLCQYVGGEALQLDWTVDDMKGFRAWSKQYRKYAPKTMARAILMVGQVTKPPKVKELRDVERELMKWEEKAKALTVRRDIQRHGEGRDRRLDHAPGCPGARVPVDRGQAELRRGDGQDTVRRVQ